VSNFVSNVELWLATWSAFPSFYLGVALCLGLVVGSFLNVLIYRLPKILEQTFRNECCDFLEQEKSREETISLSFPPSSCPQCRQKIKPWHNVPVLSYLLLKGKCAHCKQPISARYPIIETITGVLTCATLWLLGLNAASVVAILLLWALIVLTVIDIDTQYLPDNLTLPLLWGGLIANYHQLYTSLASALWGAIVGYISLWSVYWLFRLITKKEGMGYGDFKLLAALGAWLGISMLPVIILLSSFVGSVIGIGMIVILGRDKNIPIPFGPYLAIAGWIAFLWGDQIIVAYLHYL
jgi:leader peptidase (prepilin peptidase) / N-methyltransferase